VALLAVALLVGLAAGWLLIRDDGGGTDTAADPGATEGVAHVHGLGIDPESGTLYVATHHGVFRLPDRGGDAERVGPIQDTMGFTVAGAGRFLGSGHPGVEGTEEGQPPLLGLIESSDGAETWDAVSLSGEVDFHALAYAHDQVYGWDSTSGRFMVSADMQDWDTRSTLQVFGIAVDPDDPDHILATTPEGPSTSSDGGRAWQPLGNAPELVLVAWDPASGLWGVDPGGAVHHATAIDGTWEQTGSLPGPPQALLANGDTVYAAAEENGATGIYQSTDNGITWETRYRDGQ
jgi:hypothetical protein